MKIPNLLFIIIIILLAGCSAQSPASSPNQSEPQEIVVFAAASLTESFQELAAKFEQEHPDTTVMLNLAASQQLAQQLAQGAPADVFASANKKQMDAAIAAERVAQDAPQIFAHNRLVVIVHNEAAARISTLPNLADTDVSLILAAPEVPIGNYTQMFLDKASSDVDLGDDFRVAVDKNVMSYEQTVKAVVMKVALGEADAGVVYASDVTAEVSDKLTTIAIPDELNTIADYPIASMVDSDQPELAQTFIDYVLSETGQAILTAHGFGSS